MKLHIKYIRWLILISYFHLLIPASKKATKSLFSTSTQSGKVTDSDFTHFFEDRTKVKTPSDIKLHNV